MKKTRKVYGLHAAQSALEHTPEQMITVWIDRYRRDRRFVRLYEQLQRIGVAIEAVEQTQLNRLAEGTHHQGIVVELEQLSELGFDALKIAVEQALPDVFYLILDHVQDPQNLGACLRTADATGVHGVIITKDQSAGLTPTVYKVASGAAETVPVYRITNLARTIRWMKTKGVWVMGADGDAEQTVFNVDMTGALAIVMGAEGKGLRRLTREHCDLVVNLPMLGQVASLNVSVAAGVFLYEAVRQRTSRVLK